MPSSRAPPAVALARTVSTCGGVSAGSTESKPSVFLVNVVVSINIGLRLLNSPGDCPDANLGRPGAAQGLGAGIGGGAGGEHIVHHDDLLTGQPHPRMTRKNPAHVLRALPPGQLRLGHG